MPTTTEGSMFMPEEPSEIVTTKLPKSYEEATISTQKWRLFTESIEVILCNIYLQNYVCKIRTKN